MADAQDGKLYKCNMYNAHLDVTVGGSYSRLRVRSGMYIVHTLLQYDVLSCLCGCLHVCLSMC